MTKFTKLLTDFQFINIEEADRLIQWDKTLKIKLK